MTEKYKVGDEIFVGPAVCTRAGRGRTYKITKVGRKWVRFEGRYWLRGSMASPWEVEGSRFDIKTKYVDAHGYFPTRKAYPSEKFYRDQVAEQELWTALKSHIDRVYIKPPGISRDDLVKACRLLGVRHFETQPACRVNDEVEGEE